MPKPPVEAPSLRECVGWRWVTVIVLTFALWWGAIMFCVGWVVLKLWK